MHCIVAQRSTDVVEIPFIYDKPWEKCFIKEPAFCEKKKKLQAGAIWRKWNDSRDVKWAVWNGALNMTLLKYHLWQHCECVHPPTKNCDGKKNAPRCIHFLENGCAMFLAEVRPRAEICGKTRRNLNGLPHTEWKSEDKLCTMVHSLKTNSQPWDFGHFAVALKARP